MPKFSVITPVYNAANFIEETIQSVAKSDFTDYEHIIVDDGSTDSSRETIINTINSLGFEASSRVKFFSKSNSGESDTDNYALARSSGEFLVVLNADDILGPSLLRRSYEEMQSNPQAVVTYPDWSMIDESGNTIQQVRTKNFSIEELIGGFDCLPGPGACIRREVLGEQLLRDPDFSLISDYECWQRLSLRGPFIRIPEPHAFWRLHGDNLSITSRGRKWADQAIKVAKNFSNNKEILNNRRLRRLSLLGLSRAYLLAALQGTWDREVPMFVYLLKSLGLGILNGRLIAKQDVSIFLQVVYNLIARMLRRK
jgi:glycosyltransferase involved in cell wall biosynthesis